jgi:enoyl-CoA hydratase
VTRSSPLPLTEDAPLTVEHDGEVATIWLDRPDRRNALDGELIALLPQVVAALDGRDDVRAIVLTGRDPAFCAGVDLRALGGGDTELVLPKGQRGPLPQRTTPVIGAVNGPAVTGGLELALACDWLVASEHARFADTHARVGVLPGWGLSVLLPRRVGMGRAKEMSMTGRFVDAETALAWGLVNHVVPHDQLLAFARGLATEVAGTDSAAASRILAGYEFVAEVDIATGWRREGEASREWGRQGLDPAAVEARRQAIIDRGRAQL